MRFEFFIARRYLFAKKSNNAINIISFISMMGVIIMSAAFVFTLSVFNGFHDLVSSLYSNFDPELKIEVVKGKRFDSNREEIKKVKDASATGAVCRKPWRSHFLSRSSTVTSRDATTPTLCAEPKR